mgnify:CR=1 FL=1
MTGDNNQLNNNDPLAEFTPQAQAEPTAKVTFAGQEFNSLEEAQRWIEKLDQPSDNGGEAQLYIYRVQNGNARHLSGVLGGLFGTAQAGSNSATGVAPGLGSVVGASQAPYGGGAAGALGSGYGIGFGSAASNGFGSSLGRGIGLAIAKRLAASGAHLAASTFPNVSPSVSTDCGGLAECPTVRRPGSAGSVPGGVSPPPARWGRGRVASTWDTAACHGSWGVKRTVPSNDTGAAGGGAPGATVAATASGEKVRREEPVVERRQSS